MKKELFIIGDVHGNYLTLLKLLAKIEPYAKDVIFVGDLIDRGSNSLETVDFIMNEGFRMVLGNHEQNMIEAYHNPMTLDLWLNSGGNTTKKEYEGKDYILKKHINWLKEQPYFLSIDESDENNRKLLVSHSPSLDYLEDSKVDEVDWDDFLWNRKIPSFSGSGYFNVSGHNIVHKLIRNKSGFIKPSFNINTLVGEGSDDSKIIIDNDIGFASIDSGVESTKARKGLLSALSFPSKMLIQQENIG